MAVAPSPKSLAPVLLLPLAAAGFYALAGIITWSRCQQENAGAMPFTLNLCLCLVAVVGLIVLMIIRPAAGGSFIMSVWPGLNAADWSPALLLGVLAVIATAVALAYRLAPTPVVGISDTAYLGFAAVWGVLFFGEVPTSWEGLGIARSRAVPLS